MNYCVTKVLLLSNNLSNGGAERVLVNLANALVNNGYDVTLRVLADVGANKEFLSKKINYSFVFKKSFRGLNYLYLLPHRFVYNIIVNGKYDIVIPYLHGVLTKIVSYAPKNQKTIAFLHANMENSPFMRELKKSNAIHKCFDSYDRIVSVSHDVQESFIKSTGINDNRLTVCYNIFDVDGIRRKAKDAAFQTIKNGVRLCSVGKLDEVKGYKRLITIAKRLYDEGFALFLTIVGEGVQRSELEQYIAKNGMFGYVTLVGFDPNPYKYIAASDLFVCSSFTEGFSSVVAESLILGVPVLTTDCAGMSEMLGDNNEYGMIVGNNEEALYEGLKKFLLDPKLLRYYTEKAKERAAFFEPEATVGAVEELFKTVLENNR